MKLWPNDCVAAALVSFDVDCESGPLFADERNAERPITMSQFEYGATVGVYEILRILRRRDVRATFFVPTATAELHPDSVRMIVAEGHEIGLHGHLHEPPFRLPPAMEREILESSSEILEKLTGSRSVGYRAPWAEVNPSTVDLLREFGLLYDSSFMGDIFPYLHGVEGDADRLVELPIHWSTDDWGYSLMAPHVLGAPEINVVRTADDLISLWRDVYVGVRDMGGLFTPTGHPEVMGRPNRLRVLDEILALIQGDGDVYLAAGEDIANWWKTSASKAPTGQERMERP
ncbi:MAG: polysaccharide deacetylase [Acidimicrobiia bacterium]|nr:polysaccharide deacetylase [Acidimicrobiia bacterium]